MNGRPRLGPVSLLLRSGRMIDITGLTIDAAVAKVRELGFPEDNILWLCHWVVPTAQNTHYQNQPKQLQKQRLASAPRPGARTSAARGRVR